MYSAIFSKRRSSSNVAFVSGCSLNTSSTSVAISISLLEGLSWYLPTYSTENFNTFWSRIASTITYLCRHSSNKSLVVCGIPALLLTLTSNIGVPVKPNICALLKNFLMFWWVAPNWLRWHSSKINTTFLSRKCSIWLK